MDGMVLLFSALSVIFAATTACFIYSIHRLYHTLPAGSIVTSALMLLTAQRLGDFFYYLGLIRASEGTYGFFSNLLFAVSMAILAYGFWKAKLALDEYASINKSTMGLVERFEGRRLPPPFGANERKGGKRGKQRQR